jgi:hypothetical protein
MYDKLDRARRFFAPAVIGVSMVGAATLFGERIAQADWSDHTAVGVDLGLGSVITRYSPEAAPGGALLYLSVRADYDLSRELALQLLLRQWSLPGSNHATMPGVGARYVPYHNELGWAYVDGAVGVAFTRDTAGFAFDVGAGFDLEIPTAPGFTLGPVLRYGQVVDPSSISDGDGRAWNVGISGTYHFGRAAAAAAADKARSPSAGRPVRPYVFKVQDSDHDGVTDDADQCPDVPAGRHPDAFRPGCPENDEDKDGVPDSDDICPVIAAGDHPDPKRRGCPFIDSDGDGIADLDDHCPDKAGPATNDPATNGCPPPHKPAPYPAAPPAGSDLPMPGPTSKKSMTRGPR